MKDLDKALYKAALEGKVETIEVLLKEGANVNAKCENGRTALHVPADLGPVVAGRTALHAAACMGQAEAVKVLRAAGAK